MSRRSELALLLMCVAAWTLASVRMRGAIATEIIGPAPTDAKPTARAKVLHDAARISRQGAFRPLGGRPAAVDTVGPAPMPVVELPPVALKGIMGGPPWLAVLSLNGVSGEDRVLRAGDSLGLVAVRTVEASGVSLQFRDSTWTIMLREERTP